MKIKSKFLSSVIVSLLAGFIYFLFGKDISVNVQSSVKAILSYNDSEQYLTAESFPFNNVSKTSGTKKNKDNSGFYLKKKHTIEFIDKGVSIPGEGIFSDYVSDKQAKIKRPVADRNIDFTAELNKLIVNGSNELSELNKSGIKQTRVARINSTLSCNEYQIAQQEKSFKITDYYQKDIEIFKYNIGNGFEYNYLSEDEVVKSSDCEDQKLEGTNDCKKIKIECKSNNINMKEIKIIIPKINIRINGEEIDFESEVELESPEINSQEDENVDSM